MGENEIDAILLFKSTPLWMPPILAIENFSDATINTMEIMRSFAREMMICPPLTIPILPPLGPMSVLKIKKRGLLFGMVKTTVTQKMRMAYNMTRRRQGK